MSDALVKATICKKLEADFERYNMMLTKIRRAVLIPINSLKTAISSLQYSAIDDLNNVANSINSNIDSLAPSYNTVSKYNQIMDIIRRCPYLNMNGFDPLLIIRNVLNSAKDMVNDAINPITDLIAEFSVAKIIDTIVQKYGPNGLNLGEIVQNLLSILDCIDSICGSDITGRMDQLTQTMEDMYILSDGSFDRSTLYSDVGITDDQKASIEKAVDSYSRLMDKVSGNVNKGVEFAKKYI